MLLSDYDYETYEVYVTDSSLTAIPYNHLCGSVDTTILEWKWMIMKCSNGKILPGNRIVLQKRTDYGRLGVYEIRIFSKLKRTAVVKIALSLSLSLSLSLLKPLNFYEISSSLYIESIPISFIC